MSVLFTGTLRRHGLSGHPLKGMWNMFVGGRSTNVTPAASNEMKHIRAELWVIGGYDVDMIL